MGLLTLLDSLHNCVKLGKCTFECAPFVLLNTQATEGSIAINTMTTESRHTINTMTTESSIR